MLSSNPCGINRTGSQIPPTVFHPVSFCQDPGADGLTWAHSLRPAVRSHSGPRLEPSPTQPCGAQDARFASVVASFAGSAEELGTWVLAFRGVGGDFARGGAEAAGALDAPSHFIMKRSRTRHPSGDSPRDVLFTNADWCPGAQHQYVEWLDCCARRARRPHTGRTAPAAPKSVPRLSTDSGREWVAGGRAAPPPVGPTWRAGSCHLGMGPPLTEGTRKPTCSRPLQDPPAGTSFPAAGQRQKPKSRQDPMRLLLPLSARWVCI